MIPIFVVNLSESSERKEFMSRQFAQLKIQACFVDAIDGRSLTDVEISEFCDSQVSEIFLGRSLAKSELGCYLSHLKIYKTMKDKNIEKAIILEDDVVLKDSFLAFLDVASKIPADIDFINFANYPNSSKFFSYIRLSSRFILKKHVTGIWGTYGYYISRSGAEKIIKDSNKVYIPIDFASRVFGRERLNAYVIHPYILKTDVDQLDRESVFESIIARERKELEKGHDFRMSTIRRFILFFKRLL